MMILASLLSGCGKEEEVAVPDTPATPITVQAGTTGAILGYEGDTVDIPFTVTGGEATAVSVASSTGCSASARLSGNAGTVSLTLTGGEAAVRITVTGKGTPATLEIRAAAYRLGPVKDDISPRDGDKETIRIPIDTNLPDGMITVNAPEWVRTSVTGGTLELTLEPNTGTETREATVTVSDKDGRLAPAKITIVQEWLNKPADGLAHFPDRALALAVIAAADRDSDKRVSEDEAATLGSLDAGGKGITSIEGIGQLRGLVSLDLSGNRLEGLADLSSLRLLHSLDISGNPGLTGADISGCRKVFDRLVTDNGLPVRVHEGFAWTGEGKRPRAIPDKAERRALDVPAGDVDRYARPLALMTHTRGNGIPIDVIITGLEPEDVTDGSLDGLAEWVRLSISAAEPVASNTDLLDVTLYPDGSSPAAGSSDRLELRPGEFGRNRCAIHWRDGMPAGSGSVIPMMAADRYSILHEVFGHGLAGLLDEYEDGNLTPTSGVTAPNVDSDPDPESVAWAPFLRLEAYRDETGVFEGADGTSKGRYRPSLNSIMREDDGPGRDRFNAPSRYAVFCALMRRSGLHPDWVPDYSEESFGAFLRQDRKTK